MGRKEERSRSCNFKVTRQGAKWGRMTLGRRKHRSHFRDEDLQSGVGGRALVHWQTASAFAQVFPETLVIPVWAKSSEREGRKEAMYPFSNSAFLISAHLCSSWMKFSYYQISLKISSVVGVALFYRNRKKSTTHYLCTVPLEDPGSSYIKNYLRMDEFL